MTHGAFLNIESLELIEFLLQDGKLLGRNLADEELGRETGITVILGRILDVVHSVFVLLARNPDGATKLQRIDTPLLVHDDHHVVRGFVVHHQSTVAVGNQSTSRILYLLEKGI